MVFFTKVLLKAPKGKFIDRVRVFVKGGGGGQGLPKFGGVGGKGGDVYVVANKSIQSLKQVLAENPGKRFIAGNGGNSSKRSLLGKSGKDVEIAVPLGICVKNDVDRELGEVNENGDRVLVARGGLGGDPTNGFSGAQGERRSVKLDLRLIADVGLVGFPNAGKSTLLKAVSRASPKIADYPFTTIRPNVAVMEYTDFRQISMADLPGLIEGAHINVGMGHNFLKHVERTKMLLFVVDVNGFRLGAQYSHRTAFETVMLLNKEVELYKPDLLSKPALLALNKIDTDEAGGKAQEVIHQLSSVKENLASLDPVLRPDRLVSFEDIVTISAKEKTNTQHLQNRIRKILDYYAELEFEKASNPDSTVVAAEAHTHLLT